MTERYRPEQRLYLLSDSRTEIIQASAELLAENLSRQKSPTIVFDGDGPLYRGTSFHTPELTTPAMIPALTKLEARGISIGLATARGRHAVDFLREQGLKIEGAGVLEGGHLFIKGNETKYIAVPGHMDFIRDLRRELTSHPAYVPTWNEVKDQAHAGKIKVTKGNYQWQGECRASFWFTHDGSQKRAEEVAHEIFQPAIESIAIIHGLTPQRDIQTSVTLMYAEDMAIFGIKGNVLGKPVDKASVLQYFMEDSWAFAADGVGDLSLAKITKEKGGIVIGIRSHLDKSDEVDAFLDTADATMDTSEELVQLLDHTGNLLAA